MADLAEIRTGYMCCWVLTTPLTTWGMASYASDRNMTVIRSYGRCEIGSGGCMTSYTHIVGWNMDRRLALRDDAIVTTNAILLTENIIMIDT